MKVSFSFLSCLNTFPKIWGHYGNNGSVWPWKQVCLGHYFWVSLKIEQACTPDGKVCVLWSLEYVDRPHYSPSVSHSPPYSLYLTIIFLRPRTPFSLNLTPWNLQTLKCPPKVPRKHSWEHCWETLITDWVSQEKDWHFSKNGTESQGLVDNNNG